MRKYTLSFGMTEVNKEKMCKMAEKRRRSFGELLEEAVGSANVSSLCAGISRRGNQPCDYKVINRTSALVSHEIVDKLEHLVLVTGLPKDMVVQLSIENIGGEEDER